MPIWLPLALIQKKRKQTFFKRLGFQSIKTQSQQIKPIWIHALSVGEVLSAIPIVKAIYKRWPHQDIIFSASTLTGYEMAQKVQSCVREIIYYPYDFLFSVKRMISIINPQIFILVESDIWPNFLTILHQKKIPSVLVNARLSKESFRGYRLLKWFMQPALSTFKGICVQSDEQAKRFLSFDIDPTKISVSGNVKFDQDQQPLSLDEILQLKKDIDLPENIQVIIAGSTHEGEEKIFGDMYSNLKKSTPNLKMIIAPRDPGRAKEIQSLLQKNGLSISLYSKKQFCTKDVLIIDQMGILGKLYAVCDIAFVGGSLVPEGGHNPLEPAAMSKPIVFGPDMHDFPEISKQLVSAGAAFQVQDSSELSTIFHALLKDTQLSKRCGEKAFKIFSENQGAVEKTLLFLQTQVF